MKNKRSNLILLIIASFILVVVLGYLFYLINLVKLAYQDQAPNWFTQLIADFYPRFFVEKKRFDLAFFIEKADQVIARLIFISSIGFVLIFINSKNEGFLKCFFNKETSTKNISVLRILYFSSLLILFYDIYWVLTELELAKVFYKPILLLKLLHIEYPGRTIIAGVCLLLFCACITGIFNVLPVVSSIVALILSIYIQGLIFSFEKIDHGFAPITYAGMIVPFLLYEDQKARKKSNQSLTAWALILIQTLICLCYFFSGLEKVFISKLQWIKPETFKTYLQIHNTTLGLEVANNNFLCTLLPIGALLFQLGFISILFNKKLKYVFLPIGIVFHISSYYLFDVGGILHPWMLTYFFFIDWNFLKRIKA